MSIDRTVDIQSKIFVLMGSIGNITRLDRSSYQLDEDKVIMFKYSRPYTSGDGLVYWFGVPKEKFESYIESHTAQKFFVLFVCGSEQQVLVIPSTYLSRVLADVATAMDNCWKLHIFKRKNRFEISVTGKPNENITEYFNKFELLVEKVKETPRPVEQEEIKVIPPIAEQISIENEIMNLDNVQGNTLHDKLVDMLRQIGGWMRYISEPSYMIRPDAPYRIDVVWLLDNAVHIAIEVQIGGNITEAKARLIFAKRFGARKCVIVSNPESVDRIKRVFRYDTDIKHWVEIWGFERIYNMFIDGRNFFENFNELNKHQYRDDIIEVV